MYTEKDFFKDNPPSNKHFAFPWEETYHQQQIAKIQQQARDSLQAELAAKEKEILAKEKEKEKEKERAAKEEALSEIEVLKKQLGEMKK